MTDYITLVKLLGQIPMENLIIIGVFMLLLVIAWRLPNIINAVTEYRKINKGLEK
ncbi:MAG: hypothetical protein KGV56_03420 [Gammaproteobacteria bacterium]|nr:hypothetical protein [Gammaproteobacteria bacterium]